MCLGVPAEVVEISDPQVPRAKVAIGGIERMVATDLLLDETVRVGDWVLIHVGFALSAIDAEEAALTLEQIKRLGGDTYESELESFKGSAIE